MTRHSEPAKDAPMSEEEKAKLFSMVDQHDQIEKVIVLAYVEKLNKGDESTDALGEWLLDMIGRYRRGEDIYVSELGM